MEYPGGGAVGGVDSSTRPTPETLGNGRCGTCGKPRRPLKPECRTSSVKPALGIAISGGESAPRGNDPLDFPEQGDHEFASSSNLVQPINMEDVDRALVDMAFVSTLSRDIICDIHPAVVEGQLFCEGYRWCAHCKSSDIPKKLLERENRVLNAELQKQITLRELERKSTPREKELDRENRVLKAELQKQITLRELERKSTPREKELDRENRVLRAELQKQITLRELERKSTLWGVLERKITLRQLATNFRENATGHLVEIALMSWARKFSHEEFREFKESATFFSVVTKVVNGDRKHLLNMLRQVARTFKPMKAIKDCPWSAEIGEQYFTLCVRIVRWNRDDLHPNLESKMEDIKVLAVKGAYICEGADMDAPHRVNLEELVIKVFINYQ